MHRISSRIFLEGSRALNLNFLIPLKNYRNQQKYKVLRTKLPLQGNAAAGHPSLFPKIMISEPGLALVWSGTGLVLVRFGTDTGQASTSTRSGPVLVQARPAWPVRPDLILIWY